MTNRIVNINTTPSKTLLVFYYLMFDLTFTISFLLILKTHFYHSPKWYRPQPLANERTLSNDPSADSTYRLLALNHSVPLPSF